MKKKIAVYANGWSYEAISHAIMGMKKMAVTEDFDIFVFVSFANISVQTNMMQGELNVYKLCDIRDYDGAIVFSNMMNSDETAIALCQNAKKQGVPVISVGMNVDGIPFIGVNGNTGMRELVTHLVEKHGVKTVSFIGGAPGHAESDARMAVTAQVLEEHGLEFSKDEVYYGGWSNRRTVEALHALLDKGKGLPDALICANDVMALAAATELDHLGYEVPRDVIVTGYDHTLEGRIFYPALTSVRQNYDEVGYEACRMIFDSIRSGKCEESCLVDADLSVGESCGCKDTGEFWTLRKNFCRHYFQKNTDTAFLESTERNMRQKISDVSSYAELKRSLRDHYNRNHRFEGDNLHLILDADYFGNVMISEQEIVEKKSRKKLDVVVSLKNGSLQDIDRVERHVLIPGYEKIPNEQHAYYFMPLHFQQYNYGYLVLADEPYIMEKDMLHAYMEKLTQALKLLRTNLRLSELNRNLTELYDKDPMTGLFNRFGYENKAIPLYQESVKKHTGMMVMFVDINYMKKINDRYGHIHGDAAILAVADSIRKNIREEWIAVRFGGDEFLIIAPECDRNRAAAVKESILEDLENKNRDGLRPYRISASCGYVVTDPDSGYPLQEYIREADRLMYEIKREVHARDELEEKETFGKE